MTNPKTIEVDGRPMPIGGLEECKFFGEEPGEIDYLYFLPNAEFDSDQLAFRHFHVWPLHKQDLAACVAAMYYRRLASDSDNLDDVWWCYRCKSEFAANDDKRCPDCLSMAYSERANESKYNSAAEAWGEIIKWQEAR